MYTVYHSACPLGYSKWYCKYHVVFAPKYRRKACYDARRVEVGQILKQLREWKGIHRIEAEECEEHVQYVDKNTT